MECAKEFKKTEAQLLADGKINDQVQLEMYGLIQQGNIGDCNTERPGMFSFSAKAQWDAWNALKGSSKEEAQFEFIQAFKAL